MLTKCRNLSCGGYISIVVLGATVGMVASGCVGVGSRLHLKQVNAALPESIPQQRLVSDAPVIRQTENLCGAAALGVALSVAGFPVDAEALASETISPTRNGSLQLSMLGAARRQGAVAYQVPPTLSAIILELAAGHPVVVLQNLRFSWWPLWHYATVVGYDLERAEFTLHSGGPRPEVFSFSLFDSTWEHAERWALVVLHPSSVPATATEEQFLRAVSALERAGQPTQARLGYQRALRAWPGSVLAYLGIANTYRTEGLLGESIEILEHARSQHPTNGAVLNNLASALLEAGAATQATAVADQCLSQASQFIDACERTLSEIKAATLQ